MPPENTEQPILHLQDVHKSFGEQCVLNGISLAIPAGQTTVILGESGTGKSVLLKVIIGLIRADAGSVRFKGTELTTLSEPELAGVRRHFGFLFQAGALFDSMTAFENVVFPLRQHTRLSESEIRERGESKLRLVGLVSAADKMPAELSGGQKKRVALARAIALDPEVILYDEPTTGLDPVRSDVINELIRRLQASLGVTSIVVTHDMNSAYKVADRLHMLYHGKFVFGGTAAELKACEDETVKRFVTGQADKDDLAAIGIH